MYRPIIPYATVSSGQRLARDGRRTKAAAHGVVRFIPRSTSMNLAGEEGSARVRARCAVRERAHTQQDWYFSAVHGVLEPQFAETLAFAPGMQRAYKSA